MTRVLVIDDDDAFRGMLVQAFEREGFEVEEASNGEEGLSRCLAEPPDLVVTDIMMPERDGLEIILALRKLCSSAKIIAVSGGGRSVKMDFLPAAQKMGASVVMHKPIDPVDLIEKVRQLLPSR